MCRDGRHSCFGIQSVLYFPGLFLLCPLHPHLRHRQFHASSRNILCVGYNVECYLDVQCTSKQWCRGLFRLVRVNQWSFLTETSTKIALLISGLLSLTIGGHKISSCKWLATNHYLTDPHPQPPTMLITDPLKWPWLCTTAAAEAQLPDPVLSPAWVSDLQRGGQVARSCSASGGGGSSRPSLH